MTRQPEDIWWWLRRFYQYADGGFPVHTSVIWDEYVRAPEQDQDPARREWRARGNLDFHAYSDGFISLHGDLRRFEGTFNDWEQHDPREMYFELFHPIHVEIRSGPWQPPGFSRDTSIVVSAITEAGEELDPRFPPIRRLTEPVTVGSTTVGQAGYPWGDEWWIVMIAMRTVLEEMTPVQYASPVKL